MCHVPGQSFHSVKMEPKTGVAELGWQNWGWHWSPFSRGWQHFIYSFLTPMYNNLGPTWPQQRFGEFNKKSGTKSGTDGQTDRHTAVFIELLRN